MTGTVGMITDPERANDVCLLARELLREPSWPIKAAKALGFQMQAAEQYGRAF